MKTQEKSEKAWPEVAYPTKWNFITSTYIERVGLLNQILELLPTHL